MVEQKPSKLTTRVRFPSPAPAFAKATAGKPAERWIAKAARRSLGEGGPAARDDWHSSLDRVDSFLTRRHMARLPAPGEVAEWLKAADCKSARASVRWFESSPLHHCPSEQLQN